MHTPNPNDPTKHDSADHGSTNHDTSKESLQEGFEVTDVSVQGILVFLVALFICVSVFFVFCFGMGKVINNALEKNDGPVNKWNASGAEAAGKLRNMESNPAEEQQQLHRLAQSFPTPRLQIDDGNQDVANLHQREDLYLNYYTWADRAQGKVRIPISRAMELIAQRGLPVVAGQQATSQLMAGDAVPVVQVPLTNGFAPTAFEEEERSAQRLAGEQASTKANNN